MREIVVDVMFNFFEAFINIFDERHKVIKRAVFCFDRTFPVPLVDILSGCCRALRPLESRSCRYKCHSRAESILRQLHTLPFRERMNNFCMNVVHRFNREFYWSFDSIKIVVDTRSALHKKRRRHATKIQVARKTFLEIAFNIENRLLHHLGHEFGNIARRYLQRHLFAP